jgi:hypothetical protein
MKSRDLYAASYIATKEIHNGFSISYAFMHNVCIFPAANKEEATGIALAKAKREFPSEEGYGDHDVVVLSFQAWVEAYGEEYKSYKERMQ